MANPNENEFSIFGLSVDDLDTGEKQQTSVLYKPRPDNGKNGIYDSLIRFLPNIKNPRKPYIRKWVYWLEDAEGKGFYVDSPSTVGEKCPIQDMFFKLRNSESAVDKKNSDALKRKEVYYGLVQVVSDDFDSDAVGQAKIWRFGYKIKNKIDDELNPKHDEPTQIFDPFNGKNFELTISKQGGFPNYDSSKFLSKSTPMKINGKDVSDNSEGRAAIMEYLKDAPELSNFEYQPWDDAMKARVAGVLAQYKSPGSNVTKVTTKVDTPVVETAPDTSTVSDSNDAPKDGSLDDFLADLDL